MRFYLDHAATTPLLPEAYEAMRPWLEKKHGNPSSLHAEGLAAKTGIDEARETLSQISGCLFAEFLFTSGGTESANWALVGAAMGAPSSRRRILISEAEHHCVIHSRPLLERLGFSVEFLPVDPEARIDLDFLELAMGDDVLLVAAMHANNELGTYNDLAAIAQMARRHGALLFVDAVQTFPHISEVDADLIAVSAHKLNGPKAVGGLIIRAGTSLDPLIAGGGQEREMRGGTENVAGIAGFAAAARVHAAHPSWQDKKRAARDAFVQALEGSGLVETVDRETERLPGHAHFRLPGVSADSILIRLDRLGIAASSGAACSSGSLEPSHVLMACGYSELEAGEGLRFTFGWDMSLEDARKAAALVREAIEAVQSAKK